MTGWRSSLVDAGVVLVLMATSLSILDDTFAGRSYLVAGLVPVGVLLLLALLVRRLDEGGWWYTLAALVIFGPLGAIVALREPGPFLVPSISSVSRVLSESLTAPIELVGTVPPVEPAGTVMLVPFVIGFLAALPAAWLALAGTRSFAPAVPLVVALVVTIPLGVLVPGLLVPRGIFFAIVLVSWTAVRARRRETLVGSPRGTMFAAATAIATVTLASGLGSLLVPDDNTSDRVLLSGDTNAELVSGAATTARPPTGAGDALLLRAKGVPRGQRLRFVTLDQYTGTGWVPAEESPGSDGYGTFKRIGPEVSPLHEGRTVVVRVRIRPGYNSDWLPMMGELTNIDLAWNRGRTALGDIRYNQATSSAVVIGGVDPRDRYSFESVVTDDGFTRRDPTRDPTGGQRQPAGAFLDADLDAFARDDLLPLERVLLLARYLKEKGAVVVEDSMAQGPEVLSGRMLGAARPTGTPFQYAATMALGASRLGVPARVVIGADVPRNGRVEIADVRTWVELQLADGTWRSLDPDRFVGTQLADDGGETGPAPDPQEFVEEQLADAAGGQDQEVVPPPPAAAPDEPVSPWSVVAWVALALVVLLVLGLLLVPILKVLRRARRRRTTSWSALHVNGWQEILDAARDRGTPVPEWWGRVAQASGLGVGLELARRADAAVFAPGAGPDDEGRAFWRDCEDLRREVLAAADRRHRLWARVNPASLVAGWARTRSARGTRGRSGQVRHEDRGSRRQQPTGA